ncbi:putative carboxylesterase 2 [Platanthera guangdongensis]|uniref:Carboxylesterase 2 n=1 Tax=Platanthera guangdongensis TaxID=2320717 RepID=A0ABR2MDZ6_9ASPA
MVDPAPKTAAPAPPDGEEVEIEFHGFFRLYKNGRFERLVGTDKVPASLDPDTRVESKDVTIDQDTGVSARLYLPPVATNQKLPFLVYFHGGAFCLESSASPIYHRHLNTLSSLTPLLAVSVEYRLVPEHPLPAAYDDSWTAIRWVFSLTDPWLAEHADLDRVFLAGDSAGGNIAHNMAIRVREFPETGITIKGLALIHPYFWGSEPVGSELTDPEFRAEMDKIWNFLYPGTTGPDDPKVNPFADGAPNLALLGCEKLLVTVAENDPVKHRGKAYYEKLKESDWGGEVELLETPDAEHVFHLFSPDTEKAKEKIKILVNFFNKQ